MSKKAKNNGRGLSKSILRVCITYAIFLSLGAGIVGFATYTVGMIHNYDDYIGGILNYTVTAIDGDDLEKCAETLERSEKYDAALSVLDRMKETHNQVQDIYIVRPVSDSARDNMMYLMLGQTRDERAQSKDNTTLGDLSGDEYDRNVAGYYVACMNGGDEVSFYANRTSLGTQYTGMLPIRNSAGEAVAVLAVDISLWIMAVTLGGYILVCFVGWIIITGVFQFLLYRWMKRRVIRPVQLMEQSASAFVADCDHDATPESLHFEVPDIHTGDEMQTLSDTLCRMSDDVKTQMANMLRQTKEKERIAGELGVARQIQANMLPSIFPPFPNKREFDLYAMMDPAKEVGGDFYDFFLIDDTHLALVMADVSGKGVPAALFMVIAKTLIKNRVMSGGTPAEILYDINNQLCEGNTSQLFVTVWLAILDIETGKGLAANAGHEDPIICRANGEFEAIKYRHSLVLAALENIPYAQHEFELRPGDTLFVYTDGVTEATNASEVLYGSERLLHTLNAGKTDDPKALLRRVRGDIDAFAGTAPQFDDITMLAIVYYGKDGKTV